jgi:hypothetical protein
MTSFWQYPFYFWVCIVGKCLQFDQSRQSLIVVGVHDWHKQHYENVGVSKEDDAAS